MKILIAIAALLVAVNAQANICEDELLLFTTHPDRCESFIICMLQRPITLTCDPNFIWDQNNRRCRLGSRETCEFRFGPEPSCEDQVFSIHYREDTCTAFFICMLGERINFTCDEGEIFDIYRRACLPGDSHLCITDDPTPYNKV